MSDLPEAGRDAYHMMQNAAAMWRAGYDRGVGWDGVCRGEIAIGDLLLHEVIPTPQPYEQPWDRPNLFLRFTK